jgi:hypothetical protein
VIGPRIRFRIHYKWARSCLQRFRLLLLDNLQNWLTGYVKRSRNLLELTAACQRNEESLCRFEKHTRLSYRGEAYTTAIVWERSSEFLPFQTSTRTGLLFTFNRLSPCGLCSNIGTGIQEKFQPAREIRAPFVVVLLLVPSPLLVQDYNLTLHARHAVWRLLVFTHTSSTTVPLD